MEQKTNFPAHLIKKVADLVPSATNARTHSDEQVDQIVASIREFGFTNPILTDGKNGIIAGHGRLLAAQKLGMREVPIIELSSLTPAQIKAYMIADNKIALNAGWDLEILALEFEDLNQQNFELGFTGFSSLEIHELQNPQNRNQKQPPGEFKEFDENIVTHHACPSCGYEWSGKIK